MTRKHKPARGQPFSPHFFANPLGSWPNFGFGVLRTRYLGTRANSAAAFARLKLRPGQPPAAPGWRATASRWEVLLPVRASDDFLEPQTLMERYEAAAVSWRTGLLCCVTLKFPGTERLHASYEKARSFARTSFALNRELPVLLIQHAPHLSGSANPPHVHLLIVPRTLGPLGFGTYSDELTSDQGQKSVYDEWSGDSS